MMKAEKITNYKSVIKECFSTDADLISHFHISAGEGLNNCVERTYSDLRDANVSFYRVSSGGELVGFFGIEPVQGHHALTGFFIKPEMRTKKSEFWSLIKDATESKPFLCGVYSKNTRAVKFLKSMGGVPVHSTEDGVILCL